MKFEDKAFPIFRNVIIVGIFISVIYGLSLILMPGINPYLMYVLPLFGSEFDIRMAIAENAGRLFGKISSVFAHPMTYGLFLSMAFIYTILNIKVMKKNKFLYLLLFLIVISIFTCGIRTPIATLLLCSGVYIVFSKEKKILGILIFSGIIVYITLMQIPEFSTYVSTMFSADSEDIKGSSISLRIEQLEGAFTEIAGNELTGLGYGWTAYFISTFGGHPIMLHFESVLIIILCNSGYIGVLTWFIMTILYYKHVRYNYHKQTSDILLILLIAYLSYSFITGEYGYMRIFLIFYAMIVGYNFNQQFHTLNQNLYEQ